MDPNTTPPTGKPTEGERLEVTLETMGSQAMAVARTGGFTLLVERGIPGERVEVEVNRVHSRHATAHVTQVLEPSSDREAPPCPVFEACGGCDWQHVKYETQVSYKREVVNDQLQRIGGLQVDNDWPITTSPEKIAYRDKVEFVVTHDGLGYRPALHGVDPSQKVAIKECLLVPPEYTTLAATALEMVAEHGDAEAIDPSAPNGLVRMSVQGTLASGGNEDIPALALTLHFARRPKSAMRPFLREQLPRLLQDAFPNLETLLLSFKGMREDRLRNQQEVVAGRPFLLKPFGADRYRLSASGFFQVNPAQARNLRDTVLELVKKQSGSGGSENTSSLIYDLFCGVGLYALPLARQGYRVVGIEKQREAVRMASNSAKNWGVRADFQAADLANPGVLKKQIARSGSPQLVLVNPPRAGLPKPLMETLLQEAPPALIYISCDGGTFARDAQRLASKYTLESLQGFDLFPQTHHLELVGVFRRIG